MNNTPIRIVVAAVIMITAALPSWALSDFARRVCGVSPSDSVAVVPAGVTEIPPYAFADCSSLSSVSLPASLRSIGEYAFLGCSSLRSIDLPASLTSIGEGAFRECTSLRLLDIPSGVTVIPRYMCAWDKDLESVSLPSALKDIQAHAFAYCSSLREISPLTPDPSSPHGKAAKSRLLHIGSNAFTLCESLVDVSLPASITELESYAFAGCSSLERLELPANDKMLGEYMVTGCPRLRLIICRSPKRPTFDCDSPLFDPHEDMHPEYETPGWSF